MKSGHRDRFASYTAPDDASYIAGAAMGIWCDNPDLVTEDVVTEDIADEMRLSCDQVMERKQQRQYGL